MMILWVMLIGMVGFGITFFIGLCLKFLEYKRDLMRDSRSECGAGFKQFAIDFIVNDIDDMMDFIWVAAPVILFLCLITLFGILVLIPFAIV